MADEREEEQFNSEGQPKQFGQENQQPPAGQQGEQQTQGQQGQSSSGQTDLAESGDTATLSDDQGGTGGFGGSQDGGTGSSQGGSGGFIGSQGGGSSEPSQDDASTAESDFASQGQGALEDEDIESGEPQSRTSDIDGSSGNI